MVDRLDYSNYDRPFKLIELCKVTYITRTTEGRLNYSTYGRSLILLELR
jgi:hypothetical protein